eukprot:1022588-Amphidinium_carterae.1
MDRQCNEIQCTYVAIANVDLPLAPRKVCPAKTASIRIWGGGERRTRTTSNQKRGRQSKASSSAYHELAFLLFQSASTRRWDGIGQV